MTYTTSQTNMFSNLEIESEIDNEIDSCNSIISPSLDYPTQVNNIDHKQVRKYIRNIDPTLFSHETTPLIRVEEHYKDALYPKKETSSRRVKTEKITIATSYNVEKAITKKNDTTNMYINTNEQTPYNAIRSDAFAKLDNKDELARSLKCTKACKNVITKTAEGDFGTCYREICSFAHSADEWQPPKCQFGSTCRLLHGRNNNNGIIYTNTKCKFIHDNENIKDWKNRTEQDIPDLPPTNEKSRKPISKPTPPNTPLKSSINVAEYVSDTLTVPNNVWNTLSNGKTVNDKPPINTPKRDLDSQSSNTDIDVNHTKNNQKYHKSHSKSKPHNCQESNNQSFQIIRVPTNELAKIAIKAALERGVLNIQVELI